MAAGREMTQTLDTTGIAPGASILDVAVLDHSGMGQLSDVLAGIDWVIYRAAEYNIRVMNLSLAADSTESWRTDPLARAVRSATAAGITVVVAPGNKVLGAKSVDNIALLQPSALPARYPQLTQSTGSSTTKGGESVMMLSGTSVAAPVVAGAVALLLQASPGLTPPLIKAILQYSAQPLAGANLLQQGAGLLNIAGANLLASGWNLPPTSTTLNGRTFDWSRIVYAGGNQIVGGAALLTQFQPIWDLRLVWAGKTARRQTVSYWPAASPRHRRPTIPACSANPDTTAGRRGPAELHARRPSDGRSGLGFRGNRSISR